MNKQKGTGFRNSLCETAFLTGVRLPHCCARAPAYGTATSTADEVADWRVEGEQIGADFAYSVAMVGDVDGDGYADVALGAPIGQQNGVVTGYAAVNDGPESGLGTAPQWMTFGTAPESGFGAAVEGADDVDGNGYADEIVGAPYYSDDQPAEGAVLVFFGWAGGVENVIG